MSPTGSDMNNVNPKRTLVKGMSPLPPDFVPSNYSVFCGRGKGCYNATGNRRLRVTVSTFLQQYVDAQNRPHDRTRIICQVLDMIKQACPVGAFIKYENGWYYELSDKAAREKIGALFRDCLMANQRGMQGQIGLTRAASLGNSPSSSISGNSDKKIPASRRFSLQEMKTIVAQKRESFSENETSNSSASAVGDKDDDDDATAMSKKSGSFYDMETNKPVSIDGDKDGDDTILSDNHGSSNDIDQNRSVSMVDGCTEESGDIASIDSFMFI